MHPVYDSAGQINGYKILRSTVGHLLTNPMYIGRIYREGELVKEIPELALVSEETFWAVQAILERNQPRWHENKGPGLLSGLLFCTSHKDTLGAVYHSRSQYRCIYEQNSGLTAQHCFIVLSDVLDTPDTEAVLGEI